MFACAALAKYILGPDYPPEVSLLYILICGLLFYCTLPWGDIEELRLKISDWLYFQAHPHLAHLSHHIAEMRATGQPLTPIADNEYEFTIEEKEEYAR